MFRFYRNIARAMRSSVKHTPTLLPSRVEECRLSFDVCRFVLKVSTVLPKKKAALVLSNGEIVEGDTFVAIIMCIKISLVIEEKIYVMPYSYTG